MFPILMASRKQTYYQLYFLFLIVLCQIIRKSYFYKYLYIMHCQDQPSTFNLKLIFVNDIDGQTRECIFSVPFIPSTRQLRLNEALDDTCHRMFNLFGTQLFQVDFANRMHIFLGVYPFQRQVKISYESVINGSIQINMKPSNKREQDFNELKFEQCNGVGNFVKNKKVKQRTIQQALQAVKLWRKLYDTDDGNGKRLHTLEQSASIVGISKKTLDDYYSLIRTAMTYNFNLEKYKESKIGIIRKFVKIAKEEGQEGINAKMSQYLYDLQIQKYWISLSDL